MDPVWPARASRCVVGWGIQLGRKEGKEAGRNKGFDLDLMFKTQRVQ